MSDFDIHSLVAPYALDAIDADEAELFEAHLPSCDRCAEELAGFHDVAAMLAASEVVEPPASLRASVLAEIGSSSQLPADNSSIEADSTIREGEISVETEQPQSAPIDLTERRNRRKVAQRALGAVAAAVVVVLGVMSFTGDDDGLPAEVSAVIEATDATEIVLSGDGAGELKVVYSAEQAGVAVVGDGLEALTEDQTYELWAIDADGARAIGLFDADDAGEVADFLETNEDPDVTWGVTVEPAGGSPQPTTNPIFVS